MKNIIGKIINEVKHGVVILILYSAMFCPNINMRRVFYRLLGVKVGKHVDMAQRVYVDEVFPGKITIKDHADLGPGCMILTHDSSKHTLNPNLPYYIGEVVIGERAYIGAGAIILPGVTIGDNAVVGAGAVVTKDVESGTVVAGVPAQKIKSVEEYLK